MPSISKVFGNPRYFSKSAGRPQRTGAHHHAGQPQPALQAAARQCWFFVPGPGAGVTGASSAQQFGGSPVYIESLPQDITYGRASQNSKRRASPARITCHVFRRPMSPGQVTHGHARKCKQAPVAAGADCCGTPQAGPSHMRSSTAGADRGWGSASATTVDKGANQYTGRVSAGCCPGTAPGVHPSRHKRASLLVRLGLHALRRRAVNLLGADLLPVGGQHRAIRLLHSSGLVVNKQPIRKCASRPWSCGLQGFGRFWSEKPPSSTRQPRRLLPCRQGVARRTSRLGRTAAPRDLHFLRSATLCTAQVPQTPVTRGHRNSCPAVPKQAQQGSKCQLNQ